MYSEKIFPYLALMRIPYLTIEGETAFINLYLIIDDELVLIDTGPWRKNFNDLLSPLLSQWGFSLKDISRIIYTHAHPDHMGGGVQLRREGNFIHSIHSGAKENVEQYGRHVYQIKSMCKKTFFDHLYLHPKKLKYYFTIIETFWYPTFGEIKIDHGFHDGEIINTGKLKFEVIYTPGHSPWDISLWEPEKSILFSGDFLMEKSATFIGGLDGLGSDLNSYNSSLNKIGKYLKKASWIFPSHGIPIGNNAANLAGDLSKIIKRRENKILSLLSTRKCSLMDLISLFSVNNNTVVFARQLGVLLTHVEKLEKEDRIFRVIRSNGETVFSLKG